MAHMQTGLYIVGTPIGNLSDFSERAVETLKNMDLVLCEDTRVSSKLFNHFEIKTILSVFAEYNEKDELDSVIEKIKNGSKIAIITDSGMPSISDPGFRLVRECRNLGLSVFVVPGPVAATAALVLSGFPTDRFTFCGFFKDEAHLREDNKIRHTIIYYESPNRIMDTVKLFAKVMPERRIAIVREITKMYEETIIGYPADLIDIAPPIGEIVIVVEPAPEIKMSDDEISKIVNDVIKTGVRTKDAATEVARITGISKSDAYNKVIKK